MRNHFVTTTLIALAAAALSTPAAAEWKPGEAADGAATAEDKATNAALLAELLDRRALVASSSQPAEAKSRALHWLDTRIAKLKSRTRD